MKQHHGSINPSINLLMDLHENLIQSTANQVGLAINLASISNQFVYVFWLRWLGVASPIKFGIVPIITILFHICIDSCDADIWMLIHVCIHPYTLMYIYTYIHTYIHILYRWQIWAVRLMRGEAPEFFETLIR